MDPKFQTSFIPKKQSFTPGIGLMSQRRPAHHVTSIFMMIAVLMFIASLSAVAGAYVWKQHLLSLQTSYKTQLIERESQFNMNLVEQLKQTNVQIDTAKQLLSQHIALSQIFGIIQQITVSKVRFLSMQVGGPSTPGGGVNLSMTGYGSNLPAVAFQSDILGRLQQYNLYKVVKNPIVSEPTLETGGKVSFGFSATIDPTSLSYTQMIGGSEGNEASSTTQ